MNARKCAGERTDDERLLSCLNSGSSGGSGSSARRKTLESEEAASEWRSSASDRIMWDPQSWRCSFCLLLSSAIISGKKKKKEKKKSRWHVEQKKRRVDTWKGSQCVCVCSIILHATKICVFLVVDWLIDWLMGKCFLLQMIAFITWFLTWQQWIHLSCAAVDRSTILVVFRSCAVLSLLGGQRHLPFVLQGRRVQRIRNGT